MKYFLDSAKIDEIREAYDTFGIDGITTNPNHIMNSGKPFFTVIAELADFVKEKGIEGCLPATARWNSRKNSWRCTNPTASSKG